MDRPSHASSQAGAKKSGPCHPCQNFEISLHIPPRSCDPIAQSPSPLILLFACIEAAFEVPGLIFGPRSALHVAATRVKFVSQLLQSTTSPLQSVAMAPDKPPKSMKQKKSPTAVADFTILPLTLPALAGLPPHHGDTAKHYMYIKPHSPSIPTTDDERSLFIANVPIDATEKNLRVLFADQLGGAMVERVEFDASIPAERMHKRFKSDVAKHAGTDAAEQRGKKRKRNFEREEKMVAEGVVEDEDSALPAVWNGEVRKSGSGAVVVFVDKKSARGAMKEVAKAVKEGRKVSWKSSGEGLGIERTYTPDLHPTWRCSALHTLSMLIP